MSIYYKNIDGLRLVAILLVFIEHFAYFIGKRISAGYFGVDLFFVISGFLITSILLKSSDKPFGSSYKNFLGRRTLRIFPIYYLTILVLFLLNVEAVDRNLVYLVTYTYNYASIYFSVPLNPVSHFWSLCVEEQFYLFWPFVVLGFRRNANRLFWILIPVILFAFCQMSMNIIPKLSPYNYQGLLTRMGSLAMGALGSVLVLTNRIPKKALQSSAIEVLVILLIVFSLVINHVLKYPVLSICSLFLVLKSSVADFRLFWLKGFLSNRHIIFLGTISYGLYVYHLPIGYFFDKYVFDKVWTQIKWDSFGVFKIVRWNSWLVKFPLYSFFSIVVASFSYYYVEAPILKLKDRFFRY